MQQSVVRNPLHMRDMNDPVNELLCPIPCGDFGLGSGGSIALLTKDCGGNIALRKVLPWD